MSLLLGYLKTSDLEKMLNIIRLIESWRCSIMEAGWLHLAKMYKMGSSLVFFYRS